MDFREVASPAILIFDYGNINILLAEICGGQFTARYNISSVNLRSLIKSVEDWNVLKALGVRAASDGRGLILRADIGEDQLTDECNIHITADLIATVELSTSGYQSVAWPAQVIS